MNNVKAKYPKRLIEVDLPIKRISAHARREKSIRHGHISTLHIWWARRPLVACRAVICASLWPDPADPICPEKFIETARGLMKKWAKEHLLLLKDESHRHFVSYQKNPEKLDNNKELRRALLDFIADFSNWDNSTNKEFLETSRKLTQVSHESLGGISGTRPLVVDPFAGGGSIPLEALRVGADAFASDLNPVAILLNKVVLEHIPKYGQRLANEVKKWGEWVKEEARRKLSFFYPSDTYEMEPITYLWARVIRCEGPNCGVEIPLIRSLWLSKKRNNSVAMKIKPNCKTKRVDFEIIKDVVAKEVGEGTVRRGAAVCPFCDYTTPVKSVRRQLKEKYGGILDARLFCVVSTSKKQQGRFYRLPNKQDLEAVQNAIKELKLRKGLHKGPLSLVPDESTEQYHTFVNRGPIYGMFTWEDFFLPRQLLTLTTFSELIQEVGNIISTDYDKDFSVAVQTSLSLCFGKVLDLSNACCRWEPVAQCPRQLFSRQAIPIVWDVSEGVPIGHSSGSFEIILDRFMHTFERIGSDWCLGNIERASATNHPLPDDFIQCLFTDPPYYYSVQYADLSDFFYVWLRRILFDAYPKLFQYSLTPKKDEIIVQSPAHEYASEGKNKEFYERNMKLAMMESKRILSASGIGIIVFAHTSTSGWESMLQAMVEAGWVLTGSWPIDTEMATRVIAQNRSVLASSIHLVCRPRLKAMEISEIGDWRDVLQELPSRIHEWMPRLASEGVVGADAIFACLGPALEIFSRYSSVEKASGEEVTLREYLEHVWAAVSKEALNMIFEGSDSSGFEEDSRLTAMWLWTLSTGTNGNEKATSAETQKSTGYILEYDAVRKIAQGLGAHLDKLSSVAEIKGAKARLLPVSERARYLFGKGAAQTTKKKKKSTVKQLNLFEVMGEITEESEALEIENATPEAGKTILDRVHQSMLLFATNRGEALKRFLVEDGVGRDTRFWGLAQALSALYPPDTDEKRWVDGVLARKKSFGF